MHTPGRRAGDEDRGAAVDRAARPAGRARAHRPPVARRPPLPERGPGAPRPGGDRQVRPARTGTRRRRGHAGPRLSRHRVRGQAALRRAASAPAPRARPCGGDPRHAGPRPALRARPRVRLAPRAVPRLARHAQRPGRGRRAPAAAVRGRRRTVARRGDGRCPSLRRAAPGRRADRDAARCARGARRGPRRSRGRATGRRRPRRAGRARDRRSRRRGDARARCRRVARRHDGRQPARAARVHGGADRGAGGRRRADPGPVAHQRAPRARVPRAGARAAARRVSGCCWSPPPTRAASSRPSSTPRRGWTSPPRPSTRPSGPGSSGCAG